MLGTILDLIDRSNAHNKPVYVHCFAGRGRTGTVVGAYLIRHGFSSPKDVLHKIAELRSTTPHGWDSSPQTMEQVDLIKNWKRGE